MRPSTLIAKKLKSLVARAMVGPPTRLLLDAFGVREVHCDGVRVGVAHPRVRGTTRSALWLGFYEAAERRCLHRFPPRTDVLEFGASIGVMSCLIARQLPRGKRLIAVEADAELAALARANLAANGLGDRAEVRHAVVVADPEAARVFARGDDHLVGRLVPAGGAVAAADAVPTIDLAQLSRELAEDRFAIVCDIEGEEWNVFGVPRRELERCERVYVEVHPRPGVDAGFVPAFEAFTALMAQRGFTLEHQDGAVGVFGGLR